MKLSLKSMLAVSAVLTIGLFASCSNEVSGDITVSNKENTDSYTKSYFYKASGTVTATTNIVEKSAGSVTSDVTTTVVASVADPAWEGTWTTYNNSNSVTYTFTGDLDEKKTIKDNLTDTSTYSASTSSTVRNLRIYKYSGKCYVNDVYVKDLNPEADTVTLNFTVTPEPVTEITGSTDTSAAATTGDKTKTTTNTYVYALTFTRK